jgi:hypothetical protein
MYLAAAERKREREREKLAAKTCLVIRAFEHHFNGRSGIQMSDGLLKFFVELFPQWITVA